MFIDFLFYKSGRVFGIVFVVLKMFKNLDRSFVTNSWPSIIYRTLFWRQNAAPNIYVQPRSVFSGRNRICCIWWNVVTGKMKLQSIQIIVILNVPFGNVFLQVKILAIFISTVYILLCNNIVSIKVLLKKLWTDLYWAKAWTTEKQLEKLVWRVLVCWLTRKMFCRKQARKETKEFSQTSL